MISAHSSGWRDPRVLVMLLAVFLCGASAGMLVMALGAHRMMHAHAEPAWKDTGKEKVLQRFQTELSLSPGQTEQLETILDDFFTYYHTLQAQLDDVRASGKQRMLRILDENQKKKFEKIMSEMQDKALH
jgi:hypothetical protein